MKLNVEKRLGTVSSFLPIEYLLRTKWKTIEKYAHVRLRADTVKRTERYRKGYRSSKMKTITHLHSNKLTIISLYDI